MKIEKSAYILMGFMSLMFLVGLVFQREDNLQESRMSCIERGGTWTHFTCKQRAEE